MLINKEKLKEYARLSGIARVGVTSAEPLLYMDEILQRRSDEGRISPFEESNPALRLSPGHLLSGCRSIITFLLPYDPGGDPAPQSDLGLRGLVARCARGIDYHFLLEQKARQLIGLINKESNNTFEYKILCDRSPLLERELARNSGLGWVGKNCNLINPVLGSFTGICTILLDGEIEPDEPLEQGCTNCSKCIAACPSGAIEAPGILNPYRCLSYLTQASGIFPRGVRTLLQNRIYGCDLCQEVCPYNQDVKPDPPVENRQFLFPAEPLLLPILSMTRGEFENTIGLTSAGWRGKTTLQRNAVIALGNSLERSAAKSLAVLLENDRRPLIRLHAAWSLGRMGGEKAKFALEKSLQRDPERVVREEAYDSLQAFS